jgi:drug/metabolite transporter (DMT)-like permease
LKGFKNKTSTTDNSTEITKPPWKDGSKSMDMLPVAAILGAVFLWGSSFCTMRIVLENLSPMGVLFCRYFIAFICLIPISKKIIPKTIHKGDWKILISMALFQPCLYFLFESNALIYTTSSQAGIISACLPLMVAVAARIFLFETLKIKTIIGLILSIIGVIFLTVFQSSQPQASNPVLGNLLEVGAMASACAYMILIKQLSSRYSAWTLTGFQVTAGMIFFLPGIIDVLSANLEIWQFKLIGLLIFLGAGVSLTAFALYNWGISKIEASTASVFINLIPVTAIFLGWIVLGETLNQAQSIATTVVIAGIFISNRK